MSAQKAEQIYDAKQYLQRSRDYVLKLEAEAGIAETLGDPKDAALEARIRDARAACEATEARIAQMESAYEKWDRRNYPGPPA